MPNKNKQRNKKKIRGGGPPRTKSSKKMINQISSAVGGVIGNYLAGGLGQQVGRAAGSYFAKLSGFGDYKVRGNTLFNKNVNQAPRFGGGRRNFRITHTEFIRNVVSSSTPGEFDTQEIVINPSVPDFGPWLSRIAQNFEQYRIKGLNFFYKPTSGRSVGSTDTALGVVILATRYDVEGSPFYTKKQMETYEFCTSCIPSEEMLHPVECDPKESPLDVLYCRDQAASVNRDRRFHDLGILTVATEGMQGASVQLGELWVTYDIEFYKPRWLTSPTAFFRMGSPGIASGESLSSDLGYGVDPMSNLDVRVSDDLKELTIVGEGTYLCEYHSRSAVAGDYSNTSNTWSSGSSSVTVTASNYFCLGNGTGVAAADMTDSNASESFFGATFQVDSTGIGNVVIPVKTLTTSTHSCVITITKLEFSDVESFIFDDNTTSSLKIKRRPRMKNRYRPYRVDSKTRPRVQQGSSGPTYPTAKPLSAGKDPIRKRVETPTASPSAGGCGSGQSALPPTSPVVHQNGSPPANRPPQDNWNCVY